jgi:Ca-activated chloride channel family protein
MMLGRLRNLAMAGLTLGLGQPPAAQPVRAADDAPTADACAALGFPPAPPRDGYRPALAGRYAPPPSPPPRPAIQKAPLAQAPTIPPLPVPPVEHRLQEPRAAAPGGAISEMVVTGQARAPYQRFPAQPQDTERYPGAVANPIRQTAQEPVSTFSVDVDTAAYSNVRRFLNAGQRPPTDAVRVEELVNYFDYGYARPQDRAQPFSAYVALAPSPWSSERQIRTSGCRATTWRAPRRRR